MPLTFAAYLITMRDTGGGTGGNIPVTKPISMIQISNRRLSARVFGQKGRRHIYDSIREGKINLEDEAIRDLNIQFTKFT
jgi:hypothetical protein